MPIPIITGITSTMTVSRGMSPPRVLNSATAEAPPGAGGDSAPSSPLPSPEPPAPGAAALGPARSGRARFPKRLCPRGPARGHSVAPTAELWLPGPHHRDTCSSLRRFLSPLPTCSAASSGPRLLSLSRSSCGQCHVLGVDLAIEPALHPQRRKLRPDRHWTGLGPSWHLRSVTTRQVRAPASGGPDSRQPWAHEHLQRGHRPPAG